MTIMLLILFCDELLGCSVILFAFIHAFYLIFKGKYGTKKLLLWWGSFTIAVIVVRTTICLCFLFESIVCTIALVVYITANITKSDFNIFSSSQKLKSYSVFNVYLFCKIFLYGTTIFLVWGCMTSFPEVFRSFIMKNMHKKCPLCFDVLINIFLFILGLILLWCPLIGMWVETI